MMQKASFVFIDRPENAPYEVAEERILIGRSKKQADFAISGDPHISRVHAEVVCDDGRFTIRNKGRNPLLVNGQSIEQCVIEDGDMVKLGLTEMRFVVETAAEAGEGDAGTPPVPDEQESPTVSDREEISQEEKTRVTGGPAFDGGRPLDWSARIPRAR